MKNIFITTITILAAFSSNAQVLYNNGATLTLTTGATVQVNGDAQFQSGSTLTNNGMVNITGNVTNNQTMPAANAGTLNFIGTTAQTLSGSSTYYAKDVIVNNANGVTINAPLTVDGVFNFTNGIVTASTTANAVTFTSNGTVSSTNPAKDASHVNGFVVKQGTGSFTYPVGDGTKYQKVDVNPSANATGIRVKYNASDAGADTFTTGGTEATALVSYNTKEHWDITPLTTATGAVTVYWDGYKDAYSNAVNQRKVAHLSGGNWQNEGTIGTGTTTAGSVTSNAVSSWSPFALGSISTILPLHWLSITGNLNTQKQATISWQVAEQNVANYVIEKSNDANNFSSIATENSKGDGTNNYSFTEATMLSGTGFYRIKQINRDGSLTYSTIIKLAASQQNSSLVAYPNPVKDLVNVTGATIGSKAILTDISGKLLQKINIINTSFTINMSSYSTGVYILKADNGVMQKIVKE